MGPLNLSYLGYLQNISHTLTGTGVYLSQPKAVWIIRKLT